MNCFLIGKDIPSNKLTWFEEIARRTFLLCAERLMESWLKLEGGLFQSRCIHSESQCGSCFFEKWSMAFLQVCHRIQMFSIGFNRFQSISIEFNQFKCKRVPCVHFVSLKTFSFHFSLFAFPRSKHYPGIIRISILETPPSNGRRRKGHWRFRAEWNHERDIGSLAAA